MKKAIFIGTVAAVLATQTAPVNAAGNSKTKNPAVVEESVGVGSGAVIGALAGGPVGAIVGAGLGAWLGNRVHDAGELEGVRGELSVARAGLSESQGMVSAMRRDLASLEAVVQDRDIRIAQLETMNDDRDLYRALSEGLEIDVLFRTGDADLANGTGGRLAELAKVLMAVPGLDVRLDGFADPRGNPKFNEQLSLQRVASVERVLRAAGLGHERIRRYSHGENRSQAAIGDLDGFALERRVSITFVDAGALADSGDTATDDADASNQHVTQLPHGVDPAPIGSL